LLKIKLINAQLAIAGLRRDIDQEVASVAKDALQKLAKHTPKRSGRARSNWRLTGRKGEFRVTNKTPYIERLNQGYSKQSPKGITRPAIREVLNKRS